jgi:hypothetical protein
MLHKIYYVRCGGGSRTELVSALYIREKMGTDLIFSVKVSRVVSKKAAAISWRLDLPLKGRSRTPEKGF